VLGASAMSELLPRQKRPWAHVDASLSSPRRFNELALGRRSRSDGSGISTASPDAMKLRLSSEITGTSVAKRIRQPRGIEINDAASRSCSSQCRENHNVTDCVRVDRQACLFWSDGTSSESGSCALRCRRSTSAKQP
jgi:hypothetical protein